MFRRLNHLLVVLAGTILLLAAAAHAQNSFEKLVNPGPLAAPHAKFEEKCESCHKAFSKEAQTSLCLDCHKEIKSDQALKQGFHGMDAVVRASECTDCHGDHKGRDFKQARFEPLLFNHDLTDFKLDGLHRKTQCEACHLSGKKFRDAGHTCFSCHEKDQPHLGNLGTKCESCHNTSGWQKIAAFDHDKTKFPLRGAHVKPACMSCHLGEIYKGLPATCTSCHAIQDVHLGAFKAECDSCHTVDKWTPAKFDHGRFTRFALLGAHAKAACEDCHGANHLSKIPMACFDCHKKQDVHKAQLGPDCAACHQTVAWRDNVRFDHDLTKFPLLGMHAAVACEACHASPAFQDAETSCFSCHKKDDVHEGRLTTACESCHSAAAWQRVTFDHDRDTKYPLIGAHAKTGCNACHTARNVASAKLPTACISCHKKDDVHRGAFGDNCARCHGTSTFRQAVIGK